MYGKDGHMTKPLFREIYSNRIGLFVEGRCVADYRPAGRVWRVTQYFPCSMEPYRQVLVSSERVAREVALELAEILEVPAE